MRLQTSPRKNEAGYERKEDAAHQTRHPGRPIGTPKVDYRRATQAGIGHVLATSVRNSIREVAQRPKFGRLRDAIARCPLRQQRLAKLLTVNPKWELGGMNNRLRIGTGTLSARCCEPIEE
jgi:hypothetical protein